MISSHWIAVSTKHLAIKPNVLTDTNPQVVFSNVFFFFLIQTRVPENTSTEPKEMRPYRESM
jgi:hypothetical protein